MEDVLIQLKNKKETLKKEGINLMNGKEEYIKLTNKIKMDYENDKYQKEDEYNIEINRLKEKTQAILSEN